MNKTKWLILLFALGVCGLGIGLVLTPGEKKEIPGNSSDKSKIQSPETDLSGSDAKNQSASQKRNVEPPGFSKIQEIIAEQKKISKDPAKSKIVNRQMYVPITPENAEDLIFFLQLNRKPDNVSQDEFAKLRMDAARCLGVSKYDKAIPAIKDMALSQDERERMAAVHALGFIGGPEAFDAIVLTKPCENDRIAVIAIPALAHIRDKRAIPLFIEGLKTKTMETRIRLQMGLQELTGQRFGMGMPPDSPDWDKMIVDYQNWWKQNEETFEIPTAPKRSLPKINEPSPIK